MQQAEVKLVVLDMAGTTLYDGDAVHSCLYRALEQVGVQVSREAINAVMGIAKPIALRRLLESHEEAPADLEPLVARVYADFLHRMMEYYRTDPTVREVEGASETFRTLRQAGIKIALDTGFSRPIANTVLHRVGWLEAGLLDTTVTSDEVPQGRPYPDMIQRAMALTQIEEARCVAKVGDTPADLQQGMAAGCGWVIGVTEGSHTREELLAYPHTHLIGSIAELPKWLLG